MRLTLIQTNLHWENPAANRKMFSDKFEHLIGKTDLVVIPEMFTTGFSMRSKELAETMEGPTISWLQQSANKMDAVITGSMIIQEGENFYNRLLWVTPNGEIIHYDKKHLFTLAGEQKHFMAGSKRIIIKYKDWKICPLICYDLRFPVWSRNTEDYDLLLYVASWPDRRREAWKTLLKARAIENQCYTVGVNRVGEDGSELRYVGDSTLIDFAGKPLLAAEKIEGTFTVDISLSDRQDFINKLPFLADRDEFQL